ncbi:hypothetical protein TNCV_2382271 [Trichonephila clavipes]|nr:hypothetical protein TNCV_2382271 [Trichonephila clavipes]
MEHELAFPLHLAMYQEAELGDYITFMMNFRGVLIRLKPSEVIELETVYAVNIMDLMMAQAVLDGCFGQKWPDCVFQVPDSCSICLSRMHWPEKTQCGHAFHLRCLLRRLDGLNTLSHVMILIPAKMNSPDYDDCINMFSVLTPVSLLPPTPVASPSHEASEDVVYDSLPPMEQSTFSETPLKNPMEPSRVPESPLNEPVDSKPPIVSKSLDPPTKKTHAKKVNSIIHRSPRSKERRNEE